MSHRSDDGAPPPGRPVTPGAAPPPPPPPPPPRPSGHSQPPPRQPLHSQPGPRQPLHSQPVTSPDPAALGKPVRDDTVDLQGVVGELARQGLPFHPGIQGNKRSNVSPGPAIAARAPLPSNSGIAPPIAARAPLPSNSGMAPPMASRTLPPVTPQPLAKPGPSWYAPDTPAPNSSRDAAAWSAAAAAVQAPNPLAERTPAPLEHAPETPPPPPSSPSEAPVSVSRTSLLQLLWFRPAVVPQIRRVPAWAELLQAAVDAAGGVLDNEYFDDEDALEHDDRHDVSEILLNGSAIDLDEAKRVLIAASRKSGRLVTPLVLLEGELRCEFDEVSRLEIALGATKPMAVHNEKLGNAVTGAEAFLAGAGGSPVPALAQTHTHTLGNAISSSEVRATLDGHVRRTLVEKRAFKTRKLLGETYVRGSLQSTTAIADETRSVVIYLPEKAAALLPLFERIPVRLIGEFTPKQEQAESAPYAVKLAAVARQIAIDE